MADTKMRIFFLLGEHLKKKVTLALLWNIFLQKKSFKEKVYLAFEFVNTKEKIEWYKHITMNDLVSLQIHCSCGCSFAERCDILRAIDNLLPFRSHFGQVPVFFPRRLSSFCQRPLFHPNSTETCERLLLSVYKQWAIDFYMNIHFIKVTCDIPVPSFKSISTNCWWHVMLRIKGSIGKEEKLSHRYTSKIWTSDSELVFLWFV